MFEYLMPELFLRAPRGSLLEQSNRAVVWLQKAEGERLGRAWGVSESGYYAFDRDLNYQYRAFGYAQLAMSASAQADVVAPYAAALALPLDLSAACENLRRMSHLGWRGACGLYEAVDFRKGRLPEGAECAVVYSHMTHHQGMILAALTNALCADALVRLFFAQPRAQALSLLLEEKPAAPVRLRARRAMAAPGRVEAAQRHTARRGTREFWPDMHALYGRNATALVSTLGQGFLRAGGVFANRWTGDMLRRPEGLYVHVEEVGGTRTFLASGQQECPDWLRQTVSFEAGRAQWMSRAGAFSCRLEVCVSPEDGAYVQWLEVENTSSAPVRLRATSAFSVALMDGAELAAHPAFYALFVQSALAREGALRFTRRPRAPGEAFPVLLHAAAGNARLSYETDLARLVGRDGALGRPGGLAQSLSGTMGSVLNPCSALRMEFQLLPGEKTSICFYIGLCEPEREADWLNRHQGAGAALRARQLAQTQAVAALEHTGIGDALHHTLQRATAFLVDWRLSGAGKRLEPTPVRDLWALGAFARGAIGAALPLLVSGGIHMDGFMDTLDAMASWQPREKRLESLKDVHTGAFAVMGCGAYLLVMAGILSEARAGQGLAIAACFVLSRALSALALVWFPKARKGGMLAGFARTAQEKAVTGACCAYLALCAAAFLCAQPLSGALALAAAGLCAAYYFFFSRKYFGGTTGDIAGWFLQISELVTLAVTVLIGGRLL